MTALEGTTDPEQQIDSDTRRHIFDAAVCLILLAVFVGAFLVSAGWPVRTRIFPQTISSIGILAALIHIVISIVRVVSPSPTVVDAEDAEDPDSDPHSGITPADLLSLEKLSDEDDESLEYAFANAGLRTWAGALFWVVLFFAGMFVVGLAWASTVFAVLYLRIVGKANLLGSVIYGACVFVLLQILFGHFLHIALPGGVL